MTLTIKGNLPTPPKPLTFGDLEIGELFEWDDTWWAKVNSIRAVCISPGSHNWRIGHHEAIGGCTIVALRLIVEPAPEPEVLLFADLQCGDYFKFATGNTLCVKFTRDTYIRVDIVCEHDGPLDAPVIRVPVTLTIEEVPSE